MYIFKLDTIKIISAVIGLTSLFFFNSCDDSFIYESEGNCDVLYRVRYRYDRNLKWKDTFAEDVNSMRLFLFDEQGILISECAEKGNSLSNGDYDMSFSLSEGKYYLVAWGGLDNGNENESFTLSKSTPQVTTLNDFTCRLNRQNSSTFPVFSSEELFPLFHGKTEIVIPESASGEITDTISLTKDTNHIRIILQKRSGEGINAEDYDINIEDSNGLLGYDNSLLKDERITYRPWRKVVEHVTLGKDNVNVPTIDAEGVVADFTTGRLTTNHRNDMLLTISDINSGSNVSDTPIPVIDYILMAKSYYQEIYGHRMSDQELLDREDDYTLTFFIDNNGKWINTSILIHSWRIVLSDVDLN